MTTFFVGEEPAKISPDINSGRKEEMGGRRNLGKSGAQNDIGTHAQYVKKRGRREIEKKKRGDTEKERERERERKDLRG